MKPPPFEYHDPGSVGEALALIGRYASEARLLAGGQSLVPLLNFRLASPAALIDLNQIAELSYIREQDGRLRIGAMTRQREIEFSPIVRERLPLLAEATRMIGHLPTRTRGTIGGSIAHADPAAEYPCVVQALGGEMVLRSASGERVLEPAQFFQGFMSTAIGADEMLVEVRLPVAEPHAGWAFEEFSLRRGDFALAGIAAVIVAENERCVSARIAACAVGETLLRLGEAEETLREGGLSAQNIEDAAKCAAEHVRPADDIHATADYRRRLVRVLARRAIVRAAERSRAIGKADG